MDIRAEHYYQASADRTRQARELYKMEDSYALAMYSSGLAVECILRAFQFLKTKEFEGRHNLLPLFDESGLLRMDEDRMTANGMSPEKIAEYSLEIREAMNRIVVLWHNNYRFASESRVRAHLNQMGQYKRKKGDVLKASAFELLNAAEKIISKGVALWASRKK